jgi:hypothetical protein
MQLGADLERAWTHPAARAATRKRILRTALNEVVVRRDGAIIQAVLHWQGGAHTALEVKQRQNSGRYNSRVLLDTIALIRDLARLMPDRQIARLLNRSGKTTGNGNSWTGQRVCKFRKHHEIEAYRDGEWTERGEITFEAAANIIGTALIRTKVTRIDLAPLQMPRILFRAIILLHIRFEGLLFKATAPSPSAEAATRRRR